MGKKKFKDTTFGKILRGAVGIINPTLGNVLDGALSPEDAIQQITAADVPPEDKIRAKELILEAYEAEVTDRVAARNREAQIASAGGNDILFKTIGWSIAISFVTIVAGAVGLWEIPEGQQRLFDMAFGAVVAQMTAVVSYYFGSSFGSKQKTDLLGKK